MMMMMMMKTLLQEMRSHTENPIADPEEYATRDDVISCTGELGPDWKNPDILLADLASDRNEDDIECSCEDNCQTTPRIKTLKECMHNVSDLKDFFLDKDMGDMLQFVSSLEDKLCSHAIEMKSLSKQNTITSFFK